MKVKSIVWIVLGISIFCSSCVSFKNTSNRNNITNHHNQHQLRAYIVNAEEYKAEFKILKYSKKYDIVRDSTQADVIIELKKLESYPMFICVTPQVTLSFFSLGFYPVKYQEEYVFQIKYLIMSKLLINNPQLITYLKSKSRIDSKEKPFFSITIDRIIASQD